MNLKKLSLPLLIWGALALPAYAASSAPAAPAAPAAATLAPTTTPSNDAAPFTTQARQAILIDMTTGQTLYDKDAESRMTPSSMTKVMTMYLVFDALRQGRITLTTQLPVSETAWRTDKDGSKMFLPLHSMASVEDLIRGVVIQSGNDACIVLAEGLAGSEASFADLMNAKAAAFGLIGTHFMNSTGLPDPDHYSTARDLATITARLITDFPEYYHYFSELDFTYNGIKQGNRNPLLYRHMGVDGVKTGHTSDGGYGMIGSISQGGHRLIMVVNGLASEQARADESAALLTWGLNNFAFYRLADPGRALAQVKIALGTQDSVGVAVAEPLAVTLARRARPDLKVTLNLPDHFPAPVQAGQPIGTIHVTAPGIAPIDRPLIATSSVDRLGFWGRVGARISALFHRGAA